MEIIKKLGSWLAKGLFIGVGFAVAMYVVGYFAMGFYTDRASSKIEGKIKDGEKDGSSSSIPSFVNNYKEYGPDSGLIITSHKERKVKNSVDILGVLENQGANT